MTRIAEMLNMAYHGCKEREKPELFQDVRKWLAEMDDTPDAATSMRNKCVESVGSICDEYKADLFSTDDEAYKASLGFAVDALDRAIAKISSLTLDRVEQEKQQS